MPTKPTYEQARLALRECPLAPDDAFLVVRDLLDRGAVLSISVKVDRDEPLDPAECEPPDCNGDGGDDPDSRTVTSFLFRWTEDLPLEVALARHLAAERVETADDLDCIGREVLALAYDSARRQAVQRVTAEWTRRGRELM